MKMKKKRMMALALLTLLLPVVAAAQQAEQMLGMNSTQQVDSSSGRTQNVLAFSFNPGFITSKVDTGYGLKSWVGGLGFAAYYRCVFRSGFGFGLSYSHNQTNYDTGYRSSIPLKLDYVGPSFVMAGPVGGRWNARLSWGLGYAHYSDSYVKDDGIGYQCMGGMEYLFGSAMAFGIDITETLYSFPSPDTDYRNERNNFARLGVNVGLRIYL